MKFFLYATLISFTVTLHAKPPERGDDIRNEMWGTSDKAFKVTDVPKKWSGKSAVIIAQLNRFEYRKPVMRKLVRYNEYRHFRIKLIDKSAITKYSELSFPSNSKTFGYSGEVFVGFKVIKPNGKEIIIDPANAVTMEREGSSSVSYKKLAIPNLEEGDILDYYICEENSEAISAIRFFDPIIYVLPQEYPVMSHKLQFRVERKCYINLRSMNGAPELKMVVDEANDEKFYSLDGTDIEGFESTRWMFPYRELPTIKFRAAYASGAAMRAWDVLLGEPGEVKNSVTQKEVQDMVITMLETKYDPKNMLKYTKKNLKGVKDPFEIASKGYLYYRSMFLTDYEVEAVQGNSPWGSPSQIGFVDVFSTFLTAKKIPHDIVLTIPRNISALNDLLIENEIRWLVRVKKGDQFLYFSPFDLNSLPGTFDELLEGTQAYALDGLKYKAKDVVKTITLPTTTSKDNESLTNIKVDLSDLSKSKVSLKRTLKGYNKAPDQYYFMDPFDLRPEEVENFKTEEPKPLMGKKKYETLKEAYMAKRSAKLEEKLKTSLESEFNLKVQSVENFKIEQTGRYMTAPAFIYGCDFVTDNLVNKVGPNYIIDAGKLIEEQTKIEAEEMTRTNNIYYENPRTYKFVIEIDVPKGFQALGLENFNQKVENKIGGFTSTAKEVNGKIVIETHKHYDVNFAPASEWKNIVAFINAASQFNGQKIMLKKK